jgi:putative flavoprotein involved in K+ transport
LPQRTLGRDLFRYLEATGLMGKTVESRIGQRMQHRETLIGSSPRAARRRHGIELRGRTDDVSGSEVLFNDGGRLGPGTVLWATGYELDHSFVQLPVFDTDGHLVHQRGVTGSPGLYFLGMPWQHTRGSALLGWVKDDAQYIADQIGILAGTNATRAAPALAAQPPQR